MSVRDAGLGALAVVALLSGLIGCSNAARPKELVGTWKLDLERTLGQLNLPQTEQTRQAMKQMSAQGSVSLMLTADGTVKTEATGGMAASSPVQNGKWEVASGKLKFSGGSGAPANQSSELAYSLEDEGKVLKLSAPAGGAGSISAMFFVKQ